MGQLFTGTFLLIVLCCGRSHGLSIVRKSNDWPLPDCRGGNIDMVLVADAATANTGLEHGEHYRRQMKFFSNIIDVFTEPTETNLTRLRVSVVASTINLTTEAPMIDNRIPFDSITAKHELKRAIDGDNVTTSVKSNPLTVALNIIATFFNNSEDKDREDSEKVIIMVIDGGKPFQITKIDSDSLVVFNTTKVRIVFVLVGSEAGLNLVNVFPSNNFIKVRTSEDLSEIQNIPVHLCRRCYSGWFKFVIEKDDIGVVRMSCYKLFTRAANENFNWLDASQKCEAISSQLVTIESRQELTFLREMLPTEIKHQLARTNSSDKKVNVYIGLTRRESSLGQRFRWMNAMPLTQTLWAHEQPSGGPIQACVVWNFSSIVGNDSEDCFSPRNDSSANWTSTNDNSSEEIFSCDYWSSVGCGFINGQFYLCESEHKIITRKTPMITVNMERPSNQSIAQAVERGELAYYKPKDQYMSVSALQMTYANKVSFSGSYFTFINNNISQMTSLSSLIWFSCGDTAQTFIPYALLCDHVNHCLNQRDELVCKYRVCDTRSEVACASEQCIASELWCDLHPDCVDESDEIDCNECPHGRCPDGRCFPYHWLGDGEVDCSSCTDQGTVEEEMVASQLPDIDKCIFTCNRTKCVYEPMLNNGVVDCIGPEGPIDETLGALESAQCYTVLDPPDIPYSNWAPNCVYIKDRYGEPLGCRNMKHLEDCEDAICPEGYFKCSQSYCIPTYYVQNDEFDCPFGEDESDVELSCPGYFRCASSNICLHPNLVCDGKNDCPHSDDELNCKVTCSEGFSCLGGAVTVDTYNKDVPLGSFRFLDPRTRYLDVSGIDVSAVFPVIPKGRFLNLVYASFVDCSIKTLDAPSATQNELRAMLWIDLSYNLIETVAVTSIFRYMPGLRTLNMSHNERLSHLHPDAFNTYSSKSSLTELDLSYTSITSINAQIFASLNNLERLSLRNTLITDIVRNTFPEHFELSELDIRGLVIENLHADMFKNVVVRDALYTDSFKLCCPQLHSEQRTVDACQAPEDAFSSCSDLISEEVLRVLLWVNGFLAIIGNIVVIVYRLVIDRKILKMAYGHFVTHLSIADLLMGFYLTIIAIADTYYRGTFIWDDVSWKNSAICKAAGFLSTLSSETSTLFIALITLDRFLVIRYPFGQVKITGRLITACCVFNWTAGFLIALVPVLPSLEHWTIYNSNGMCLGLPLTNLRQPGWQFSTAIFIFLNFFLFILIAFGQIAIYKTMSDMRMNEGALTNASRRRQQDLTVAKHLSLIAITDFMCWFPVGVMGLLALDGYEIGIEAYAWSAVLVLPVNSALNPLLYTIPAVAQRWKQYREETSAHTKTID